MGEVVRSYAEKIRVSCDVGDGQRGGGCLDHCAQWRQFLKSHFSTNDPEKPAHLLDVTFERDHRHEDANGLGLRKPQ